MQDSPGLAICVVLGMAPRRLTSGSALKCRAARTCCKVLGLEHASEHSVRPTYSLQAPTFTALAFAWGTAEAHQVPQRSRDAWS